jgi:hypothetical protein
MIIDLIAVTYISCEVAAIFISTAIKNQMYKKVNRWLITLIQLNDF